MMGGKPLDDAIVIAAARDGDAPSPTIVRQLASELLQFRRADRLDSRRSGQLKKLRSTIENMTFSILNKIDELRNGDSPEELASKEPPWLADAAKALGEVAPDGTPLALNWTQVIRLIGELRLERDQLREAKR